MTTAGGNNGRRFYRTTLDHAKRSLNRPRGGGGGGGGDGGDDYGYSLFSLAILTALADARICQRVPLVS